MCVSLLDPPTFSLSQLRHPYLCIPCNFTFYIQKIFFLFSPETLNHTQVHITVQGDRTSPHSPSSPLRSSLCHRSFLPSSSWWLQKYWQNEFQSHDERSRTVMESYTQLTLKKQNTHNVFSSPITHLHLFSDMYPWPRRFFVLYQASITSSLIILLPTHYPPSKTTPDNFYTKITSVVVITSTVTNQSSKRRGQHLHHLRDRTG